MRTAGEGGKECCRSVVQNEGDFSPFSVMRQIAPNRSLKGPSVRPYPSGWGYSKENSEGRPGRHRATEVVPASKLICKPLPKQAVVDLSVLPV